MSSTVTMPQPRRRCLGMMSRRERWGLTVRGWLVVMLVGAGVGLGVGVSIHPFLALSTAEESPVMVVEAWVPPDVLQQVAKRYGGEREKRFYCVGGPMEEALDSTRVEDSSAAEAVRLLQKHGIEAERLEAVPHWGVPRDRTYANAATVREWFRERGVAVTQLTVVTEGVHGRRSRLLFEKAFGPGVRIGVVAIPDRDYDPGRWWRYSAGIRSVISETAGYLYCRLFFEPSER